MHLPVKAKLFYVGTERKIIMFQRPIQRSIFKKCVCVCVE